MKTVLVNVGTRPEVIKLAPVLAALAQRGPDQFKCVLCLSGQQRHLARQMLEDFGLTPDIDLDIMTEAQSPVTVIARLLSALTTVIADVQPAMVLAQGDTSTVLASAMAAFYARIDFGHVEAGLRTGVFDHPFPEEYHRRVAAVSATWHFAPTAQARRNLLSEAIDPQRIHLVGNTVVDALHRMIPIARHRPLPPNVDPAKRTILLTAHRRESHGSYLDSCLQAVRQAVEGRNDLQVVFPVHPNPAVRGSAVDQLGGCQQVTICDPLSYLDTLALMDRAVLVVTDSGGIQEEAACLGKPTLVIRETTERPEGIADGPLMLVGNQMGLIQREIARLLDDAVYHRERSRPTSAFGDGRAAERIANILTANDEPVAPTPSPRHAPAATLLAP